MVLNITCPVLASFILCPVSMAKQPYPCTWHFAGWAVLRLKGRISCVWLPATFCLAESYQAKYST